MKKILNIAILSLFATVAVAQQKEGKVIYEYSKKYKGATTMTTISGEGGMARGGEFAAPPPDKYELLFGNNKMTWKKLEEERPEGVGTTVSFSGAREVGASVNDVLFCDFGTGVNTTQKDIFDKLYLVDEPVSKLNWKMSGETKTILTRNCQKAVAIIIGKRMQGTLKDGKMVREEVPDTTTITAWYTTDIPVPAAPQVHGQLPGLVLELEENTPFSTAIYKAVELTGKVNLKDIKPATKGKKITPDELKKEIAMLIKQMQENGMFRMGKPMQH